NEKPVSFLRHTGCVALSLLVDMLCTSLLYEPVIAAFDIDMDGFMNMNGIVTALVIWMAVCALALWVLAKTHTRWGRYYRTLRAAQIVFLLLPLLLVVVLLFLAGLK